MIHFRNITLSFDNKEILKNFTIEIPDKQHLCFAGPSGIGKTTLLKMIQGFIIPQKGEILIDGKILSPETINKIRFQITYIPQNTNLPLKNADELIKLLNLKNKYSEILEHCYKLGLEKQIIDQNFDQISGGQKQRLIIAICLSLNRKIILMDEPTSSLDKESIEKIIYFTQKLKNKTIISTSHNNLWIENADKTIYL